MIVAIGADHRGCEPTRRLADVLKKDGHEIHTPRELTEESTDYPDFAAAVGREVATGAAERGVLVCGSGIGMSIAANKIDGVRAALVCDELSARMSRAHNDANVLCLSADLLSESDIEDIVRVWLSEPFEGGRHQRRVDKIMALERRAAANA